MRKPQAVPGTCWALDQLVGVAAVSQHHGMGTGGPGFLVGPGISDPCCKNTLNLLDQRQPVRTFLLCQTRRFHCRPESVWWLRGDLHCHCGGSPAFPGSSSSRSWSYWPPLVALFPLRGPTHNRAVGTVMAILFLFLPLGAQNQRETSALPPRYREQRNGRQLRLDISQPGPKRLSAAILSSYRWGN